MFAIATVRDTYNAIQNGCAIIDARADGETSPPLYGALSLEDAERLSSCILFGADPAAAATFALATKIVSSRSSLAGRIAVFPHEDLRDFFELFPFIASPPAGLTNPSLPHCVGRNVFLGNVHHATDTSVLAALRVTAVVNCIGGSFGEPAAGTARSQGLSLSRFEWEDYSTFSILRELAAAAAAIEQLRASGETSRVLVHCIAGVSRSPSAVAAWLMWLDPEARANTASDALALLSAARAAVHVNDGFAFQLGQFQEAVMKAGGRGAPRQAVEEQITLLLSQRV